MRILVINDFGHVVGGASAVALDSAIGLAQAGHQVHFFCAVGPTDSRLADAGVRVTVLGRHDLLGNPSRLRAAIDGVWDRSVAAALSAVLEQLSPHDTVVHLHTWVKSLSVSIVPVIKNAGFRLVVTLHDYFSACPNGGFYDYQAQTICRRRPLSMACVTCHCDARSYPQKAWRVLRHAIQAGPGGLPARVDDWISVSEMSERILRPFLPVGHRMHRVENPVDVAFGPSAQVARSHRFLFLGRLSPEKGGDILARAAALAGVGVDFAGQGEAGAEWQKLLPDSNFLGWLDRISAIQAMTRARALVFPSRWYETQGLVVAEAAALGVPAIVADCTVAAGQIVDGETGMLFRSGHVEDLANKLRHLSQYPQEADRMGQAAYARYWAAPATLEKHVRCLERVYVGMVARG